MTNAGSSNAPAGEKALILVIEDDNTARKTLGGILGEMGHEVLLASTGQEGLEVLGEHPGVRLVLSDVVMPGMDGMQVLEHIRRDRPAMPVVIMTAFASVQKAVQAMQLGAIDYLEKPLQLVELRNTVTRVLAHSGALMAGALGSPGAAGDDDGLGGVVGSSQAMQSLYDVLKRVAPTRASVLLEGPSGTGKELIAREIHKRSMRDGPLVAVHCASLPESLIESELFGHARGAFTGASGDRKGRFEEAHGGTLFLDEVSEIPRDIQVKLLRVLQEREITRVGESRPRKVDVRIISASNQDLKSGVEEGRFREDLYFRINVVRIAVPSLAERREDVPALALHFLAEKNQINGRSIQGVTPEAMRLLQAYSWPGNVRELENVIETGVVLAQGDEIIPELLPLEVQMAGRRTAAEAAVATATAGGAPGAEERSAAGEAAADDAISIAIGTPLEDVEREMILRTLDAASGNKTTAAKILGIGARTLYRKLEQYGVHTRTPEGEEGEDDAGADEGNP